MVAAPDPAAISLTELFDPRTGQWTQGPTFTPAWSGLTATRLGNGCSELPLPGGSARRQGLVSARSGERQRQEASRASTSWRSAGRRDLRSIASASADSRWASDSSFAAWACASQ